MARARGVEHAVPAVLVAHVGLRRRDGRDRDPARSWRTAARGRSRGSATAICKTRCARRGPTCAVNESPDVDPALRHEARRDAREPEVPFAGRRAGSPNRASRPSGSPRRCPRDRDDFARGPRRDLRRLRAAPGVGRARSATQRSRSKGGRRTTTRATRSQPAWPEYDSIMKTMGSLPPGARAVGGSATRSVPTARRSRSSCLPYFTQRPHRLDGRPVLRVVGHRRRSTSSP